MLKLVQKLFLGEEFCMNVYTVVSPYDILARNRIDEILAINEITRENVVSYDMKAENVREAIFDVLTVPFLTSKKAVVLKNPYFLTGSVDKSVEHDLDGLMSFLEKPDTENVLIIHAPYEKLDERKKVVKLLKKSSDFTVLTKLTDGYLRDFVKHELTEGNISVSHDVMDFLLLLTSLDIDVIARELEKIRCYFLDFSGEANLTFDIVRNLVAQTPEDNVFLLTESLALKKVSDAHSIFLDLMKYKEEPIKLLVMIANQFRLMGQIQSLRAKRNSDSDIARELSIHPYRAKVLSRQSMKFSKKELDEYVVLLADMDYKVKTGQISGELALEMIILSVA